MHKSTWRYVLGVMHLSLCAYVFNQGLSGGGNWPSWCVPTEMSIFQCLTDGRNCKGDLGSTPVILTLR